MQILDVSVRAACCWLSASGRRAATSLGQLKYAQPALRYEGMFVTSERYYDTPATIYLRARK